MRSPPVGATIRIAGPTRPTSFARAGGGVHHLGCYHPTPGDPHGHPGGKPPEPKSKPPEPK